GQPTASPQRSPETRRLITRPDRRRHRRLLRACRERPRGRPAEERDELAPLPCVKSPVLSTERIAQLSTARDCSAAAFQSGLGPVGVNRFRSTRRGARAVSALPPAASKHWHRNKRREVPKADVGPLSDHLSFQGIGLVCSSASLARTKPNLA